jgi:two-component system, NarL family, response regulator YdfI
MARLLARTDPPSAHAAPRLELTVREREVLARVARGERNKEIALHLGLTEPTVKTHLAGIFAKLGVDSRAAAVVTAMERGVLPREAAETPWPE